MSSESPKRVVSLLTIDVGNTSTKLCVFEGETPVKSVAGTEIGWETVESLLRDNPVEGIVYCAVGNDSIDILENILKTNIPFLKVTSDIPLPLKIDYESLSTLGADRIAAAVGAVEPGGSVLVADAGTALTVDLVVDGAFKGGNISPGLKLRFMSLHDFTSRLPLVDMRGPLSEFGHDTESAIRCGVTGGLVAEVVNSYINAKKIKDNIKMVLTGGDADFLYPLLINAEVPACLDCDAVGRGLVRIFNHNCNYEKN